METTDGLALRDPFRVGEWTAEPMANRLTRGDEVRRVEPKVMEVLALLAARAGETVSRDAFMEEVWGGTVVTDDVLARCISELRKALGDRASAPVYIETIRRRGYALIAAVGPPETPEAAAGAAAAGAAAAGDGVSVEPVLAPPVPRRVRPDRQAVQRVRRRRVGTSVVAVAVLALVAAAAYSAALGRVRPLATVPVTSFPGEERDPALAPDGRRVAFAWDGESDTTPDGRQFDIYVQPVGGGDPARLTTHPADDLSPAWSPDGQRVAFVRCAVGGCGISVVPADGGVETALVVPDDLRIQTLVWSPDGATLAFAARRGTSGAYRLHLLALDRSGGVERVQATRMTAPPATYPGDLDPAWSPDGRHLAFVRTSLDGRQDVCLVAVDGGGVTRLAREQRGVTGLDWTADGREVVYAANREGAAGLWRVPASGGAPRWVALGADGGEVAQPSVARTGRGLVFARHRVRSHVVAVALGAAAGATPRPLFRSTREDAEADVSPDGRRVAFVSTRSGSREVWGARSDGLDARALTHFGDARVTGPRWSPDGRRIAFSARTDGDADLYAVEPDGRVRALTDTPADEVAPAWSADGHWLYVASDRTGTWQIYRLPAAGGEASVVTRYGGVAAAELPDGGLVVVRPERRGLWRLGAGPGRMPQDVRAVRLPVRLAPADGANWTVRGWHVTALERRYDGAAVVVRVDVRTGAREVLALAAHVPERSGLTLAPDGQTALVTQTARSDADIVAVSSFR